MTAQAWLYWSGTALTGLAMAYSLAAWLASRARRSPRQSVTAPLPLATILPPVTILKPLCGAERELYDCLRSFCEQSYPRFQIVFGVREADDPALGAVRRLQREFPGLDLQLAINSTQHGSSAKVSNLINMISLARYDYLVVADSDVRVAPDYLARVVPPLLDTAVGIVTCPYLGCPRRGTWSLLGSAFINDWFMPAVYVAALFGSRQFAFGATIGLRREVLARMGGFISIADQLADDYRLGELTRRMGLHTVLSEVVVEMVVDEPRLADLVRHEVRWLRTIRAGGPLGYAFSFVTFGLAPAALGTLLAAGARPTLAMLSVTAEARLLIHDRARGVRSAVLQFWVVPLTDLLNFALWCRGFLVRRVQWRHARYRIAHDGSAHAIP